MRKWSKWLYWKILRLLGMLNVLIILVVDVWHERIALRFLASDLLVERSLWISLINLRVGKRNCTTRTVMSLIECLRAIKREVLARKSTSQSWLASRFQIISSLVTSSCLRSWQHWILGALRCYVILWINPSSFIQMIRIGITFKIPCRVHHLSEVKIIINASTNVGIIFSKLLKGHCLVNGLTKSNIVVLFEGLKKFTKYLFMSLTAFNHCRMLWWVVDTHDVFNFNSTVAISI